MNSLRSYNIYGSWEMEFPLAVKKEKHMYKVEFKNISEIRMGSPYNFCDVIISGGYIPKEIDFEDNTFQDKVLVSNNGESCFLVQWSTELGNNPCFKVIQISNLEKKYFKSNLIIGCCRDIYFSPDESKVHVKTWELNTGEKEELVTFQNA